MSLAASFKELIIRSESMLCFKKLLGCLGLLSCFSCSIYKSVFVGEYSSPLSYSNFSLVTSALS